MESKKRTVTARTRVGATRENRSDMPVAWLVPATPQTGSGESSIQPAPVADAVSATPVVDPPVVALGSRADFVKFVSDHYSENRWQIIVTSTINDMIAYKTTTAGRPSMHFIQIGLVGDRRFTGEIRNAFVQNAFSNGAIPIHAIIDVGRKTLRLRNANTDRAVRL